ncbi:DUF1161 domain-containing protein [Acerihabitans sp. TG2]|nr:DUF1161 domain-containing protein [Acerihabitans sp. TG2]MEA9391157.1 DUF1161 domain-containing protein [Acerihabitans sp. TG2]
MLAVAFLALAPLAAQASCESVKADITQKIIANGVPQSGFQLEIVPSDQADQAGGQVVGHCESDSQKIIYTRTNGNEPAAADAPTP